MPFSLLQRLCCEKQNGTQTLLAGSWTLQQPGEHRLLRQCQLYYHTASDYLGGARSIVYIYSILTAAARFAGCSFACLDSFTKITRILAPPPTSKDKSRLGPKSQGHCRALRLSLLFWCILMTEPAQCTAVADARVSDPPTGSLGAAALAGAKYCGSSGGILSFFIRFAWSKEAILQAGTAESDEDGEHSLPRSHFYFNRA